jgi:hypothetical protein
MSLGVQIDISDRATPQVAAIHDELGRAEVRKVMGRAVAQVLKDHFYGLASDAQHHSSADSLGANRTGFYERAAKAVQQPNIENDGFTVSINQVGIAQRLFGGTIEPTTTQWLAIPARTESYGRRPREFDNLKFILFPSGSAALVADSAHSVAGEGFSDKVRGGTGVRGARGAARQIPHSEGLVYFWLVKKVVQQADPTVLPKEEEMTDPALENARAYVERIWGRAA